VFVSVIAFGVTCLSARSYLTTGSLTLLLLGGGVLAFGAGNLVASSLIGPPGGRNVTVTMHNAGALARVARINTAPSASFGFGGDNTCIVLRRY